MNRESFSFQQFISTSNVSCNSSMIGRGNSLIFPEMRSEIFYISLNESFPYSVQFSSVIQSCPTLCDPMNCITNSRSSLKLTSIESVMPSSHLILCHPLLLLPPIPPSIGVFSNKSTLRMKWPKYWNFSFSISPSNEHPGLISFRIDCLDFLTVQGPLKSLLQHHSSKASILRRKKRDMLKVKTL